MEAGEYCCLIMMEVAGLWLSRPRFGDLEFGCRDALFDDRADTISR